MRYFTFTLIITSLLFSCKKREVASNNAEVAFSQSATIEDVQSTMNDISDGGFPVPSRYTGGYFFYSIEPNNYVILDSLGSCFVRKTYGNDNDSDRVYNVDTLIFNNCSGSRTFVGQQGDTIRMDYALNGQIVRSDPNNNDPYVLHVIRGTPNPFQTSIKIYYNGNLISNKTHYSHFELSTAHNEGNNYMSFQMSRTINTINEFNDCQRNWTVNGNGTVDFSNANGWHPGIVLQANQKLSISFSKSGTFISCSGKRFYVYIQTSPSITVSGSCRRPDGGLKIYSGKIVKTITDSSSFTKTITIEWNNCQDNPNIY